MGAVYLARDRAGRTVAIKIIKPEYAAQAEFRGRFRSEVNRARQVPPFCTAAVLDADPGHETPYLVVEYVDGPDLAQVVAEQGVLTGGALHSVAVGVATALVAIHGAGVIHRDLKPRNVLFALGAPKVIDFGIARALEVTSEHTRTDQMVGTLSYMAPERLDGKPVTPAVDVFAWGVLVAYAATGRTPFGADTPTATAVRILTGQPDLSGLSGLLGDLVAAALEKDPAARPTAQELLDALLSAGPGAASPRRPEPARRLPRKRLAAVAAAVLATAAAVPAGMHLAARDTGAAALPAASFPSPSPSLPPSDSVSYALFADPASWPAKKTSTYRCAMTDSGLRIESEYTVDGFTCPGPAKSFGGDHIIRVDLAELSPAACVLIQFRRSGESGYSIELCPESLTLYLFKPSGAGESVSSTSFDPLPFPRHHRITVEVVDDVATVRIDGTKVYASVVNEPGVTRGRVELGMSFRDEDSGHVLVSDLSVEPR